MNRGGRGSNMRGGRGVGLPKPPKSTATSGGTEPLPEVEPLTFTLPISISLPSIKQYQAFLRQHAWIVVKTMATMRVGQQKKVNPRSHYANSSRHIFSGTDDPIQGVYHALSEWTNAFYQ
jgi:hypothetical protein